MQRNKMKNEETWVRLIEKTNKFYASKQALFFYMSAATIISILQIGLFAGGIMRVNNALITDEGANLWTLWILLACSVVAAYAGFYGGILIFRGSLNFIYYQMTSLVLLILTYIFSHIWMSAILYVVFIIMTFARFYIWKHGYLEKWNLTTQKIMTMALGVFIFSALVMGLLSTTMYKHGFYTDALGENKPIWMVFIDAFGSVIYITAGFVMMFKSRWAFALYAFGKLFIISNFLAAGVLVPAVQQIIFWTMDFSGFIGWSIHVLPKEEA